MTQHTPGPWGICNNATPDRKPTEWVIGPMRGRNIVTTVQSNGHDARLIAAAPELLEACEASHNAKTQADLDRAVIMIEAAIAKARGQQ